MFAVCSFWPFVVRFRGFWASFLRFCGLGKTAAVCGFCPYIHAVCGFKSFYLRFCGINAFFFAILQISLAFNYDLCSTEQSQMMNNVFHAVLMIPLRTYAGEPVLVHTS